MLFRNAYVFRLPVGWAMAAGELESELARHPLTTCTGMNLQTRGWVAPREDGPLVCSLGRQLMIALGTEQKLLPAAVIRQQAEERAAQIEQVKGYKPGRKMMREIKEQVIADLLPRAFVRRRSVRAWLDPVGGWLVVDSGTPAKAEEVVEMLRNSLGGELPVSLLEPAQSPSSLMTSWLAGGEAPGRFALGDACRLIGTDESKPTVAFIRHGLEGGEVRRHIGGGKLASQVGLYWNDKLSFVLTEKLLIRKLAYLAMREDDGQSPRSKEEQFDADFALMTGELGQMLADLKQAIGDTRGAAA